MVCRKKIRLIYASYNQALVIRQYQHCQVYEHFVEHGAIATAMHSSKPAKSSKQTQRDISVHADYKEGFALKASTV
jgi:hypothetical protein